MSDKVQPIPDAYRGGVAYLCCRDAARAIDFYKQAFGAVETMRIVGPKGEIGHAEFRIGDASFMISDEHPDMGVVSPATLGGSPTAMLLYFEDVDAIARQATEAGGTLTRAVENQFYGDRSGKIVDPFGHTWLIATHIEDVSPEEMSRRAAEMYGSAK